MPEWEKYKVESWNEREFDVVYHVAHLPSAKRIVEDGRIKSGLIYDKSLLNRSRISVTWLSANTWDKGSLYGTVSFAFSWSDIIKDQKFYWVEAITEYNPTAFRILLSKRDLPSKHVKPYDPERDDGPLRLRKGKWYRAGNLTSEFMLEEDLTLERSVELDFVSHNPQYCNLHGSACDELRQQPSRMKTAARMLAHTLAHADHSVDNLWKPDGKKPIFTPLEEGYSGLLQQMVLKKTEFGGALKNPESCGRAVMGALALFDNNRTSEARPLLSLLNSEGHFKRALLKSIRRHFGDARWKP